MEIGLEALWNEAVMVMIVVVVWFAVTGIIGAFINFKNERKHDAR